MSGERLETTNNSVVSTVSKRDLLDDHLSVKFRCAAVSSAEITAKEKGKLKVLKEKLNESLIQGDHFKYEL